MGYVIGVDLGTTYTAAAVHRDGRGSIATLGSRSPAAPSVIYVGPDGNVLMGDAAARRALIEPHRVAREFKRRLGDRTPYFLDGAPHTAEDLMAKLLRWTIDQVQVEQGSAPDTVAITHPATWGPFRLELVQEAFATIDLPPIRTLTEPEAAAIHYASTRPLGAGDVLAVYDLGGGTFDITIIRRTTTGFEVLGKPGGLERLGGIDFDAAVLGHVSRSLDGALEAKVEEDEEAASPAVAQLCAECVEAKETLSSDTEVDISVFLPGLHTRVRLTRTEFEDMIRPSLDETTAAVRRALRSCDLTAEDLTTVLLVGGSSRIPLVAELLGSELGRPVTAGVHPKQAVALGAARWAAKGLSTAPEPRPEGAGRSRPASPSHLSFGLATNPTPPPSGTAEMTAAMPIMTEPRPVALVEGLLCPSRHVNPPHAQRCAVCGAGFGRRRRRLEQAPRPSLGVVMAEDGTSYELDTDYVVGRDPSNHPWVKAGTARQLLVPPDDRLASRLHATIRLEGWTVLVADLGTANGTHLAVGGSLQWQPVDAYGVAVTSTARLLVGRQRFTLRLAAPSSDGTTATGRRRAR